MSLDTLLQDSCEILTRQTGAADDFGDTTTGYVSSGTVPCRFTPRRAVEDRDGREVVVTEPVIYLLPSASVTDRDMIRHQGTDYHVTAVEKWYTHDGQVKYQRASVLEAH